MTELIYFCDHGTLQMQAVMQYDVADRYFHKYGVILLEQQESLDSFFAGIQKRAFGMALFATGDREDAFDLVQEAMCKFVEKYRKRDAREWAPLFHTVLQSRIRDWYRRQSVRSRFRVWFGSAGSDEDEEFAGNLPDEKNRSPEQQLQNFQSIAELAQVFRKLPLRQQQVVMLRIFEGMDVEQTARIMGCSGGSVKTHYSRAVHTLRENLGKYWP